MTWPQSVRKAPVRPQGWWIDRAKEREEKARREFQKALDEHCITLTDIFIRQIRIGNCPSLEMMPCYYFGKATHLVIWDEGVAAAMNDDDAVWLQLRYKGARKFANPFVTTV